MSGFWIKMCHELTRHPKVQRMAQALEMDEYSVVGRLHAVWSWLDQHSDDGLAIPITAAFLDRLVACPGFAVAMRRVKWLDGRDGALGFPKYTEHNGITAKQRAAEAARKGRIRHGKTKPAGEGGALPDSGQVAANSGTEQSREESNKCVCEPLVSLDEALAFARTQNGYREKTVRKWFAHRNGQGWVRGNSQRITDWQSDLGAWVMRGARNNSPPGSPTTGTNPKPKPETTAAAAGQYDDAWGGKGCE